MRPPRLSRPGPRGLFLLAFAWIDVLFGIGLLAADPGTQAAPGYAWPSEVLPLRWWGALWLCAAAVLIGGAFLPRLDTAAFAVAIGIKVVWGSLGFGGWLTGEVPRGYVSVGIWLGTACAVAVCARYLPLPSRDGS